MLIGKDYLDEENYLKLTQKTIKETQQIELNEAGKYKISAYTKDIKGNQSKTTEYELAINIIYYRKKNGENAQGYVLNENDNYPYEEERRLFYVALTRTKNNVYLFVNKKNESIFVKEIVNNYKSYIQIFKNYL